MRSTRAKHRSARAARPTIDHRRAFAEHLHELRQRVLLVLGAVALLSLGAYFVQQQLVHLVLGPARGQHFIYTSPGGGIAFLFQLCLDIGIVGSLPLIVYEILRFLEPMLDPELKRVIGRWAWLSGGLAVLGVAFGYTIGLPVALHFLGHQFTTPQIQPLFTISEYMSFVTVYLGGSALIFQLPLVVLFINRIRPLKPRRLFGLERWVIVGAFVTAMIMAPTTNLFDQLLIAGPILAMYQLSIGLVWWTRRSYRPGNHAELIEHDQQVQARRLAGPSRAVE